MAMIPPRPPSHAVIEGERYVAHLEHQWNGSVRKLFVGYAVWLTVWGGLALAKPQLWPVSLIGGLGSAPIPVAACYRSEWVYEKEASAPKAPV